MPNLTLERGNAGTVGAVVVFYIWYMNYYYSLPMYYGASHKLFQLAQKMRLKPTVAESRLEGILAAEPFKKYNFRRQHPIADYIADFYSHSLKFEIFPAICVFERNKEYIIVIAEVFAFCFYSTHTT